MLESHAITITSAVLGAISENEIALFTCNDIHLPNGVLLPFNSHSRQLKMLHNQLEVSKPFEKRIWQNIIKQKIYNQADCLILAGRDGAEKVKNLVATVESGDKTYVESHAAQLYFPLLFENWSGRREDCLQNSAMNYGYALFRAAIARDLASYGFIPCIGLWHHNELNNFNLADDLIEPFRPIIDLWVYRNIHDNDSRLTPEIKKQIYNLFNEQIIMPSGIQTVSTAIESAVSSLTSAINNNDVGLLKLPSLNVEVQN